ncbi:unnamed protein product [Rotaria sp. Silwood2]|nr:unnamed protein product [Rotaria sp. Silwood2]
MLLFVRLFNVNSIRNSSRSREFFSILKKSYRTTKLNLFMASNNRTCFVFDKDESTKILIQMVYEIPSTRKRRQFSLLRSVDESLSQTINRLKANIERALIKENKSNKRLKKQETNIDNNNEKESIIVKLTDDDDDNTEWIHVHRGPFYIFRDEHVNKFVRLACLPRNNSLREGMQAEHTSKTRIIPCPLDLPMNTRHKLTEEYFPIDSNRIRLVSYNILANGYAYASSTDAQQTIYPYCPQDFLEHDYRKPLLLKEILGYHADIISLQE